MNAIKLTGSGMSRMTEDEVREYIESVRWPNGPVCPHCQSTSVMVLKGASTRPGVKKCSKCRKQFTVMVGTVFERSHIPMRNWVSAFARMCASKKGISAKQLERELGITYKTAWFMCHRVRLAMKIDSPDPLSGTVEVDETYVSGKPRMHAPVKSKRGRGTRKTPVLALVERDGRVRTRVICDVTGDTLKEAIRENVHRSSTTMTDEHLGYRGVGKHVSGGHRTVCHSKGQYSKKDGTSTNTAESYFALIKRGVYGVFHHVRKHHLQRYCDEFSFRWDHRKVSDGERTEAAIRAAEGKRLKYA